LGDPRRLGCFRPFEVVAGGVVAVVVAGVVVAGVVVAGGVAVEPGTFAPKGAEPAEGTPSERLTIEAGVDVLLAAAGAGTAPLQPRSSKTNAGLASASSFTFLSPYPVEGIGAIREAVCVSDRSFTVP
jgi:hypothetical protein